MSSSVLIGVIAALLAALAWGVNFIAPYVIGPYSVLDLALLRFLISGVLGLAYLGCRHRAARSLGPNDWVVAFWLGIMGYLGYFLALVGAALYAGPVIAPAFLGLVPVILAIAGNLRQRTTEWRHLALPLALTTVGLLLVNSSAFGSSDVVGPRSLLLGVPLALAAVGCWISFALWNQSALAQRPAMDAGLWTALMMTGGGLGMLIFLPIGLYFGVFELQRLGLGWPAAVPLYIWGPIFAFLASIGGAWAWTIASQRLPVALAAQLITMETVFGTVLGLLARRRWPTALEVVGMVILLVGVVITVRAFYGHQKTVGTAPAKSAHV
jgi:drug/metabolite transporter (DMT)-like permease